MNNNSDNKDYAKAETFEGLPENFAKGSLTSGAPKVALIKCCSYEQQEVDRVVTCAIDMLGSFAAIFGEGQEDVLVEDQDKAISRKNCGEVNQTADIENLHHIYSEPMHSEPIHCNPITKSSLLVLKPNLLSKAAPEKAITTHPAVFKAAAKALQKAGYTNLKYGDSPGNPMIKVEKTAEECGIKAAADSLDIPIGEFEHGTQVEFPQGKAADKFVLCDEVIAADGIVNLCKMKTHQLERITGAVKNTFGCVYGFNKGASHAQFATAEVFGRMIADLNRLVRPKLHIMDGIIAMEGNGPASGTPKQMNLILASTDPVALDGLFCQLINLKPELVPTNVSGMEQGIGTYKDIEVITEDGVLTAEEAAERYGDKTFSVQRGAEYKGALGPVKFLAPFLEKKPVVKEERCIGCGICNKVCPVDGKAIHIIPSSEPGVADKAGNTASNGHGTVKPQAADNVGSAANNARGIAKYDYSKCIKCYCCQEMCPEEAITVKKSLLARIADRNWRI